MLQQDQINKVETQIEAVTGDRQMFTAFDITRRLRASGEQIRHSDIREVVHDMFREGELSDNYIRTLRNISQRDTAFVYHLPSHDLREYEPYALKPSDRDTKVPAPKCDVSRNSKGRVRITKRFLKKIGVSGHDTVMCYPVGRAIHIRRCPVIPRPSDAKVYHADEYGNIRLNKIFLNKTLVDNHFNVSDTEHGEALKLTPVV